MKDPISVISYHLSFVILKQDFKYQDCLFAYICFLIFRNPSNIFCWIKLSGFFLFEIDFSDLNSVPSIAKQIFEITFCYKKYTLSNTKKTYVSIELSSKLPWIMSLNRSGLISTMRWESSTGCRIVSASWYPPFLWLLWGLIRYICMSHMILMYWFLRWWNWFLSRLFCRYIIFDYSVVIVIC